MKGLKILINKMSNRAHIFSTELHGCYNRYNNISPLFFSLSKYSMAVLFPFLIKMKESSVCFSLVHFIMKVVLCLIKGFFLKDLSLSCFLYCRYFIDV